MKKVLLLFLLFFVIKTAVGQITISGIVRSNKAKPLTGVNISIKNSYDGGVTDAKGNFSFTTTEKGEQTIEAKLSNYKTVAQIVKINKENIAINFVLKEEVNELSAVTVTAGTFEAGDKKRASTVLNSLDIVTTANANADITSAVKTLPGAQQIGEQEGLFVRGGAGYETKQFIDGAFVANPFFSGAQDIATRGRFSPFLFKGTVFSTGGYSALYGQALSGALILESIDLPERSEGNASISPILAGIGLQRLAKNKKSSWGINYGYTNIGLYFNIVKQTPDYFKVPAFHNFEGNFRIKTKKGILKFYSSFNAQELGLRRQNIDSLSLKNAFGLTNYNLYTNMSYKQTLSNGWKFNGVASFSSNKDDIFSEIQNQQNQKVVTNKSYIDAGTFGLKSILNVSQAKVVFEKRLTGISTLRVGSEFWHSFNKTTFTQNAQDFYTSITEDFVAGFAESDIYLTNDLAAKVGGRFEYSSLLKKPNFAPRVSMAYKTGKDAQVSAAYGIFYQRPENSTLLSSKRFNIDWIYNKSTHYIANFSKTNANYTFRTEIFYKSYDNLVKTDPNLNNFGSGYAQGFELFWRDKKTIKNFDYWFSYSYLDTKRDFNNYPMQLQPTFAANHTASIVGKRFVTKWKTGFNFTYSYATGRPYYNFQRDINNKIIINDEGKTTDFHSLGISVNYLPNLGKKNAKTFIVLVASATNILNQHQVFGYNYNNAGTFKQEINPPAPQFFFLGCFLSWGVDRSQDAINNNL